MRKQYAKNLFILLAIITLVGCAPFSPGADPIVVSAERDTQLAADTFDLLVHIEFDQRANLKAINPALAKDVKKGADVVRANAKQWLQTARVMTKAYKYNRTAANKANLQTAMATVSAGMAQAQIYLDQVQTATRTTP